MNILAIDPGLSGSAVLIGPRKIKVFRDFKHPEDMARAVEILAPEADVAVIELVASRPGQGVASMFSFGHAAGIALGALLAGGFSAYDERRKKLIEVIPQKWQAYFRSLPGSPCAADVPFDSPAVVRTFLPEGAEFLAREKDHNTADALLMALWYVCTAPEIGSLREKDRKRQLWLKKRFNAAELKD